MILRTRISFIFTFMFCFDTIQMKPQEDKNGDQQGPCVGMDCLHGVLMHNDETQGEKHVAEDQYLRFKGVLDTEKERDGPLDAEAQLHGILMHGDSTSKDHHLVNEAVLPETKVNVAPKDLSEVIHEGMHGGEGAHAKHDWNKETSDQGGFKGPVDGEKFMHNVLMHGILIIEHKEVVRNTHRVEALVILKVARSTKHQGTGAVNNVLKKNIGPNNDLHGILMHGDSNVGHDHSHEDSKATHDVFSDISQIKDLGLDESLLKMIDIDKLIEKDRQEYANWIINNPQFQDETLMGSTIASVSDTILTDIELMKKRYLAKNNEQGIGKTKSVQKQDDYPFTAEDAKAVYDETMHALDGEDARHELELLGSTEPINARHRAKLELLKSKLEK
ncbi:uncharacterized protein LOC132715094 [Ruditapes philippinarum]|uniref:uncharacterized protein LOC132715094 n=1 Tax=Ruditapes philippinarum TaxID=129788 RepID=UPI00295B49E5|nr:uncharacterized protein LOC132715094 [Ruditapes philippinarum]